eukprot:CAMPEP_0184487620 /NCGR_PEP_ID=MMETSP0113_2-20130426/10230_1 /TAXON_ID=91329 /ORGANISM="Norrisiella sphaerica, Strain BC52" /LENGTH=347 /DNA_ID=CAMNT_0026869987 /DNA_START=120 /DNA_END=1163 /DNA_ORIENTATION=-
MESRLRLTLAMVSAFGGMASWQGAEIEPADSLMQNISSESTARASTVLKHVVISSQRSGSTWLKTMLSSHSEIQNDGEIRAPAHIQSMARFKVQTPAVQRLVNISYETSVAVDEFPDMLAEKHWRDVLEYAFEQPLSKAIKTVGFKWMLNQGISSNMDEAVKYLNDHLVKSVILDRKNHLRRAISLYHLECTQEPAHLLSDVDKSKAPEPLDIPVKYLRYSLYDSLRAEKIYLELEKKLNDVLYVPYEAMAKDPDTWMTKIYSFVGVQNQAADTGVLQKIHDGTIDELVVNWPQKRRILMQEPEFAARMVAWETDNTAYLLHDKDMQRKVQRGVSFVQTAEFPSICY